MAADKAPILMQDEEEEEVLGMLPERSTGNVRIGVAVVGLALLVVGAFTVVVRPRTARASPQSDVDFFLLERKKPKVPEHKKPKEEFEDVPEHKEKPKHVEPESKSCSSIKGVQLEESEDAQEVWSNCSAKWSHDCSDSGCCVDWNMKCYRKNSKWAACIEECHEVDEQGQTWSCEEVFPAVPHTPEACAEGCQFKDGCHQAVYSSDQGGSCRLSSKRSSKIVWAADDKISAVCGNDAEQGQIKELVDVVSTQLPFQLEWPLVNCSWGGDDCSQTKCCNDYLCDDNFENCWGYSCYKKNEYFSGCAAEPLDGWDGEVLGGPREHRHIPRAGSTAALHGTSLYCFTVVTWDAPRPSKFWNSEAELTENWRSKGLHILQCDEHDIITGLKTAVAEWGSFSNIDMFMDIWQQVGGIGKYRNFDWTVKVDSDAVFLPSRLRAHLDTLRTPLGARVYLENINYKFKFMGAIEIMTREALELFLEQGHTCIRGKHEGGEDSFLKSCLDGIGIDHQSDWQILRDKYAAMNPPCTDGWAVAYHYFKKTHSWSLCYNEVVCGVGKPKPGSCPGAIDVPHPPGYIVKPLLPSPPPLV